MILLTFIAMVAMYRVFLAIVAISLAVYFVLRFKRRDDVALGKAMLTFFAMLTIWILAIWIFVFPTMKM